MIFKIIALANAIVYVGGITCENNPCMYGVCKDVENSSSSYTCYCIDGYTGANCEINYDDCWSNPCMNGGTCIDGVANYNCSCAKGFTGERCETDVLVCNESSCENGGECIEGLGINFTCKCLEGWTGAWCEEDINECLQSPCENGGLCINLQPSYTCACLFGFTGKNCNSRILPCEINNCRNDALCLLENDQNVCYCVPDFHGTLCELQYSNCERNTTPCENGGTCISDSRHNLTCNCLPEFTGRFCSFKLEGAVSTSMSFATQPLTWLTSDVTQSSLTPTVDDLFQTTSQITSTEPSTKITERSSTTDENVPNASELLSTGLFVTPTYEPSSPVDDYFLFTFVDETSTPSTLTNTTTQVYSNFSSSATSAISTTLAVLPEVEKTTEEHIIKETEIFSVPTMPTEIAVQTLAGRSSSTDHVELETVFSVTSDTVLSTFTAPYHHTEVLGSSVMISSTVQSEATETIMSSTFEMRTSSATNNLTYCDPSICVINHYCVKFGFCDCVDDDQSIGFNGTSYLRHDTKVLKSDAFLVNMTMITKSKNGILLHVLYDNERYALLHLRLGQLQLQLSCGSQKILFGTIDAPVNNGYMFHVTFSFQYLMDESHFKCVAKLYVNGTIIMSGEQTIVSYDPLPRDVKIYVGGIPLAVPYYILHPGLGFVGCLSSLHVNNQKRNLIRDATEIHQVSNCETFNCFLNPCKNSGRCEDVNGKVKCNCLPGYVGKYCEKSICEDNPCYFGATCVTFPGSSFICVCPLGKHGLYCEKDLEITVPFFSTIMPGLSSYKAFGFRSSLKNYLEIDLRIKPSFDDQISLIAYIGQSNLNKGHVDYFAVTYVQGYLMLTWDLGSGVRRIFTDIPLDTANQKFYTLNVGRKGRVSWMHIQGIANITGSSYGPMDTLDVSPILYIGGHKSRNFDKLPHDLPLHTGFFGCITDIQMRTEENIYQVQKSNHVVGRNVGQCDSNECLTNSCKNGAVCLNHGPSYRCICMRGWEGPECTSPSYIPLNKCNA